MDEIASLVDQLERAYEGKAWHGPPLRALVADLDAPTAARRAIPGGHSIWELVRHVTVWLDAVRRRLAGEKVEHEDGADWPGTVDVSAAAWEATLAELDAAHRRLVAAVRTLAPPALLDQVPGHGYPVYAMLHGVIQHTLYHAGQIALVRRAAL